ncbi:hypothetical protein L195_g063412, partial [Trifolium pratense]
ESEFVPKKIVFDEEVLATDTGSGGAPIIGESEVETSK